MRGTPLQLISLIRASIVWKNALIFFLLITVSVALTAFLIFRFSADRILNVSRQQQINTSALVSNHFNLFVENATRDIRFFSQNPVVQKFIQLYPLPDSKSYEKQLADEFVALLHSKLDYSQIRLISEENGGREIVRVDNINGKPTLIDQSQLQFKGDREYYIETKNLKENEIYYSNIDLNKERGQVAYPLIPTFRIAAPLYIQSKFFGIIIINVDLSSLFTRLKSIVGTDYYLFLINNYKNILLHPNDSLSFAFEFGKPDSLHLYIDTTNLLLHKGLKQSENKALITDSLEYGRDSYSIYSLLISDEDIFLSEFNKWKWQILVITFFVIFGFLAIAVYFIRRQALQLNTITSALTKYPSDFQTIPVVEITREDEIGRLANALKDMTQQVNQHVNEIQTARNDAEQANRLKEEFLENMSHEIRNPLQSILGVVRLLQLNQPRPDQSAMVESLHYSAETLRSLVNDVLDYKQLQLGNIVLSPKPDKFGDKMLMIAKSHQYEAAIRKIKFDWNIDQALMTQTVLLDWLRLGQILNNLINNAIKFCPQGGRVNFSVVRSGDQVNGGYTFVVKDNGPGIPTAIMERISERYYRGIQKGNIVGTGIGINIVIGLLELFKSKLHIESKDGEGSSFSFYISCPITEKEVMNSESLQYAALLNTFISSVVAIDDDPLVLHWLEGVFKQSSIELNVFNTVDDFINSGLNIDLVITDLQLEGGLSISNLKKLHANIAYRNVLLVYFSGTVPLDTIPEADLVLMKPMNTDDFLERIFHAQINKMFGYPNLEQLYQDYDHDLAMINNAIGILIDEWQQIKESLPKAIETKNIQMFDQIFHKLVASLKRFKLIKFEKALIEWREKTSKHPLEDQAAFANKIGRLMQQYISYFKNERSKLI